MIYICFYTERKNEREREREPDKRERERERDIETGREIDRDRRVPESDRARRRGTERDGELGRTRRASAFARVCRVRPAPFASRRTEAGMIKFYKILIHNKIIIRWAGEGTFSWAGMLGWLRNWRQFLNARRRGERKQVCEAENLPLLESIKLMCLYT